ncbi:MAG: hypothetical protein QM731_12425 [Chitinophagaceae bacterium]
MMMVFIVSFYEFRQFLRIVWWIALPVTLIAVIVTVVLHYRRKKKPAIPEMAMPPEGILPSTVELNSDNIPDWLASSNPDNASLLKKYEREVRRYREDYARLEHDFHDLEGKYSELMNKAYQSEKKADDKLVKLLQNQVQEYRDKVEQLQQQKIASIASADADDELTALQGTIQDLQRTLYQHETQQAEAAQEINKLEELLKNMEQSVETSREENKLLSVNFSRQLDELGMQYQAEKDSLKGQLQQAQQAFEKTKNGKDSDYNPRIQELQILLEKVHDEKAALQQQLSEQSFLNDMLEEQKLQVNFLQNQLEQRVKNYHQLEHKAGEAALQADTLQSASKKLEQEILSLKETLEQKQQALAGTQQNLERSYEESRQQQELVSDKVAVIGKLENELQQLQQQQQTLQHEIEDRQQVIVQLQHGLAQEQQKVLVLEDKLSISTHLIERIYKELSHSFSGKEDSGEANIIAPVAALA